MTAVVALASTAAISTAGVAHADGYSPIFTAVGADGGVYWRNSANWNDTYRIPGYGFYNGDQLALECYGWGTTTPYSANHLWYYAIDLSEQPNSSGNYPGGWVNDHFLNTPGTAANPQPVGLPC